MTQQQQQADSILSMTLNQDGSCLAVGTTRGFRIYNISPFRETFRRNLIPNHSNNVIDNTCTTTRTIDNNNNGLLLSGYGGIGIVEMLFRCNLLCLVGAAGGGGVGSPQQQQQQQLYPLNKVMIYDDHQSKCIGELSFRQQVVAVKIRRDRIAAATVSKVYLYNFADLALLDQIHTISNPLGLLALSPNNSVSNHSNSSSSSSGNNNNNNHNHNNQSVLACPSIVRGHVRLELYSMRKSLLVEAHEAELGAMNLSMDGNFLATASVKGTVIRVFEVATGIKLHELRRGTERASIRCLSFRNSDNQWLATCSDKGTVHIFHLSNRSSSSSSSNTGGEEGDTYHRHHDNHANHNDSYESSGSSSRADALTSQSHQSQNTNTSMSSPTVTSLHSKLGLSRVFNSVMKKNAYLSSLWSHSQVRGLSNPRLCTFLSDSKLADKVARVSNL